ncbi:hypothetical protein U1Q18_006312 [Sarracenia purpurea var. burkii]
MERTEAEANIYVGPEVDNVFYGAHFPSDGRRAYIFDGEGNCHNNEWVLVEGVLRPPFRLYDIQSLVSNAPFFRPEAGALIFIVNFPGHGSCEFPFRIAMRITENLVITVSLNGVPRLENPNFVREEQNERDVTVIREDEEQNGNPVPKSVSNLVVYIIDSHVEHIEDIVSKLEIELNIMELKMDEGGEALKKQILDDGRLPKMHLNLKRFLKVIEHGERVFPRLKEKCYSKPWFKIEDPSAHEELIGRLTRQKKHVESFAKRVTGMLADLNSMEAEKLNRKFYYVSLVTVICLPQSIIAGG